MKRFSEQLKKQADSIRLRAPERRDLRDRLVAYMEYHPLPKEQRQTAGNNLQSLGTETFTTVRLDFLLLSKFVGAFAVLFLIVVPIVAERAVPGDVLYPVKVGFNEELRGTLTFSPYEKVAWETTRLERRIAEARLLASEGKLTPEVEAEVAEAIKSHSDAAQKGIATIRETDGEEASLAGLTLTSALDVQSEVLESDLEEGNEIDSTTPGRSLAEAVSEARKNVAATAGEIPVSYGKLLARVELETTRAYEYLDSIDDVMTKEENRDISRRLDAVNDKIAKAIENSEKAGTALPLLVAALSDTRKLISFMTNIDVRENVAIEELIPDELTEEEQIAAIELRTEELNSMVEIIANRLGSSTDEVRTKAEFGLTEIADLMSQATTSLADGDITQADKLTLSAYELAEDILAFTTPVPDQSEEEENPATTTPEELEESAAATTTEPEVAERATSSEDNEV